MSGFGDIGLLEDDLDVLRVGPATKNGDQDSGFLVLSGALIHIDIDTGNANTATFRDQDSALKHVEETFLRYMHFKGRVYTTKTGVRILLTHRLALPLDCKEELEAFNMDDTYREGCIELNAFRIRVTPKPDRNEPYICTFIERFGGVGDELAERLVDFHDKLCLKP